MSDTMLTSYEDGDLVNSPGRHQLLLEMQLGGFESSIVCSAISPDGTQIAVSDATSLRLYDLSESDPLEDEEESFSSIVEEKKRKGLRVKRVSLPEEASGGCQRLLMISPEGSTSPRLIAATSEGQVVAVSRGKGGGVKGSGDDESADQEMSQGWVVRRDTSSTFKDALPFTALAASADAQWLAVGGGGGNFVCVFALDTMVPYWRLPKCPSPHSSLSFPPKGKGSRSNANGMLVVTCADNRFFLFNVNDKAMADWSVDNSEKFPKRLLERDDSLVGAAFRPAEAGGGKPTGGPRCLLIRSREFLGLVDLDAPLMLKARITPAEHVSKRRRESDADSSAAEPDVEKKDTQPIVAVTPIYPQQSTTNLAMSLKYRPLLFADFIDPHSLVVVEEPWLKVMEKLPDPLYRQRYGT